MLVSPGQWFTPLLQLSRTSVWEIVVLSPFFSDEETKAERHLEISPGFHSEQGLEPKLIFTSQFY